MRTHSQPAIVLGLLLAAASLTHATTVFNDTFANGSTINNVTATPANPSLGAAAIPNGPGRLFLRLKAVSLGN